MGWLSCFQRARNFSCVYLGRSGHIEDTRSEIFRPPPPSTVDNRFVLSNYLLRVSPGGSNLVAALAKSLAFKAINSSSKLATRGSLDKLVAIPYRGGGVLKTARILK